MAKKIKRAQFQRLPSFQGRFMVDTVRGVLRVRRWPRPRGKPKSAEQLFWIDWFRQANLLAKYASGKDQEAALRHSKGTGLYPRDLIMSAMRGRLYFIETTDGRKLFPMAARTSVSEALDSLGQTVGDLLIRVAQHWTSLPAGTAGHVLTSQGPGQAPQWAAAGGGGGGYLGGCRLYRTSHYDIPSWTETPIPWQAEDFDDANYWTTTPNPTRITIPAGVSKIKLRYAVGWEVESAGSFRAAMLYKNGVVMYGRGAPSASVSDISGSWFPIINGASGVIDVNQGDYFELHALHDRNTNLFVHASFTWFEVEKIAA